ncbi:DUF4365 domain-containing protein [Microtetraspora fusca]|uniref:DUF4365 domain-containing protein n=1 Tax=Microtetraspora fusca TaxID=1997 RepID=UPI0009FF9F77|nr:DUF4365 domain-containing protein [Microtetraspora fusca]
MARIRPTRRIERAGVNALRTLLEENDHLVQEIDGSIDHGEDLYVIFTRNGRRTGHVIAAQVKSGRKYKRANGYAIPVDDHAQDWRNSRIPVIGVVYDNDNKELCWVNLTKVLKEYNAQLSWIPVPAENVMSKSSLRGIVAELEAFIDLEGMRVRRSSVAEVLEIAIRARRAGLLDHLDDPDDPNPLFEPLADFALKHEKPLKHLIKHSPKYLLLCILGMIMAFEWPHQVRFVHTYSQLDPVIWIGNIYLFTYVLALIMFFEFKAGRVPRFTGYIFTLIMCNFYVNPFFMGDGKQDFDVFWGSTWITVGVFLPTFGYKLAVIHYVRAALERRRRKARSSALNS